METVEILRLGHAGDGVTADGCFVPLTVPGDLVRIERSGGRAKLVEIVRAGPSRTAPACPHFGRCGGCALQMLEDEAYRTWKRDLVIAALQQRGFVEPPVEDIQVVPRGTRRRVTVKARSDGRTVRLGFYESGSRVLVDITECPVLTPALEALIGPLKHGLGSLLERDETAELFATQTDSGIDLSLTLKRRRGPDLLMALSALAADLKLARLSWNGETVAMAAEPSLRIGRYTVALPQDAFLQPAKEGERLLQDFVRAEAGAGARAADLFSGCGTFTFVLAEGRAVHAVDTSAPLIASLASAARAGRAAITAQTRDLFRRPFLPAELARFDVVTLDPPRQGAKAQAEALAASAVPRVLYISCNPASFARDARILADGGYRLERVVPVDQFLWSAHVELAARFSRG